ncbi:hypothetical protein Bca52824_064608 [Brassica carinata]|uniref:Uncharacterized protein n=1 Tax=Brassica carinata TaxID=52824 RepID=A0A8X7QHV2_BRACI|nr:hypothetical protein Bca52824_064608 [Brassica carinata]
MLSISCLFMELWGLKKTSLKVNFVRRVCHTPILMHADLVVEYQVLFGKYTELSHKNLQLINDKTILKAKVNILEMEQTDTKGESKCGRTKNDDEDEL